MDAFPNVVNATPATPSRPKKKKKKKKKSPLGRHKQRKKQKVYRAGATRWTFQEEYGELRRLLYHC